PADGPAVADLRRADRSRCFRQRRQQVGEGRMHRFYVREPRAEAQRPVLARPAAELSDLVEIQEELRPAAVKVQLHHHVGTALNRHGVRVLGLDPERLFEALRTHDFHHRSSRTYGTPRAAGAPSRRLASPVETSTSTTTVITYGNAFRTSGLIL